jgi:CheY-like chemotaxis protein
LLTAPRADGKIETTKYITSPRTCFCQFLPASDSLCLPQPSSATAKIMETDYTVFIVDDDKTIRLLLTSILSGKYTVEAFDSSESCLIRLAEKRPDLILMDVGLPGMDGYALCRQIKTTPESASIPVVFLSGHADPEDVLNGYEAGGQDYIAKPFDIMELYRKIENLQRIEQTKKALSGKAQASDELATLVLANLDAYAVLIQFLRKLNSCTTLDELVEVVLAMIDGFGLEGSAQIRMRNLDKTFSHAGENWPLEIAVINHVRSLDRIFQFSNRAAFNFSRITLLITNMPVDDADLNGRLRDNLAIAVESADAKLAAFQSFADNISLRDEINKLLLAVGDTVEAHNQQYNHARYKGTIYTNTFLDEMLATFTHLALSDQQEELTMSLVKQYAAGLSEIFDIAEDTQGTLRELSDKLKAILTHA